MASVITVTIGLGSRTSANYQSSETSVSATYTLDAQDQPDWIGFVREKVGEVEDAHQAVRERVSRLREQPLETGVGVRRTLQAEQRTEQ